MDNFVVQTISEVFGVIIVTDSDNGDFDTIRAEVRDALLGYVIDSTYDAVQFHEGELVDINSAHIWWSDAYFSDHYVRQT